MGIELSIEDRATSATSSRCDTLRGARGCEYRHFAEESLSQQAESTVRQVSQGSLGAGKGLGRAIHPQRVRAYNQADRDRSRNATNGIRSRSHAHSLWTLCLAMAPVACTAYHPLIASPEQVTADRLDLECQHSGLHTAHPRTDARSQHLPSALHGKCMPTFLQSKPLR